MTCTFATVNKAHFERKRRNEALSDAAEAGPSSADAAGEFDTEANDAAEIEGEPLVEDEDGATSANGTTEAGEKLPRAYKKRGKVSELACTFCRGEVTRD